MRGKHCWLAGLDWLKPTSEQADCIESYSLVMHYNYAANPWERHKNKEVIKRLKLLYTSKAERTFKRSLVSSEKVMNGEVKAWVQNEMGIKEKWVAALDDGGWRYGVHNTNISEVLNKVFKGIRAMPVSAIIECSFYKLNLYYVHRWQKAGSIWRTMTCGEKWVDRVMRTSGRKWGWEFFYWPQSSSYYQSQ